MVSKANPHYAEYIASLLQGTLSFIPVPTKEELAKYSAQVFRIAANTHAFPSGLGRGETLYRNRPNPVSDQACFFFTSSRRIGRTTRSRRLSQREGTGSALCLFGRDVTPIIMQAGLKNLALLDNYMKMRSQR